MKEFLEAHSMEINNENIYNNKILIKPVDYNDLKIKHFNFLLDDININININKAEYAVVHDHLKIDYNKFLIDDINHINFKFLNLGLNKIDYNKSFFKAATTKATTLSNFVFAQPVVATTRAKAPANIELTASQIQYGPLEKNLYTQELEWIAKYALRHPMDCYFYMKDNALNLRLNGTTIDLTNLLMHSDLSHICLNEADSKLFVLLEGIELPVNLPKEFPVGYTLPGTFLTDAERFSINSFTGIIDYKSINSILYHNPPEGETSLPYFYRNTFFKTLFLASGLNKITPSSTRDPENPAPPIKTFRGEIYLTKEEFKKRKLGLSTKPEGIIQKQRGFASTSTNLAVADKFSVKSKIEFHDQYGKNIIPLSKLHIESEYLQLPGYICITGFRKEHELTIFEAKSITPLFKARRSVHQEHRFYHFMNKENPQYAFLDGLLEECQFVYDEYLSKPFTENWCKFDWELITSQGVIYRPNHGLAHVMRVAQLVEVVAEFLMHYDTENCFNFSNRDIQIIQLTAIFSVVGRQNDAGFRDMDEENKDAYKRYKQTSSEAFRNYVSQKSFLNMTKVEIANFSNNILTMGELDQSTPSAILLALAHKLDLLRCFTPVGDSLNTHIINPLNQHMDKSATDILLAYAENLLHASGDRVMSGQKMASYHDTLFYAVSTNVDSCFNAIDSVPKPLPMNHKKLTA